MRNRFGAGGFEACGVSFGLKNLPFSELLSQCQQFRVDSNNYPMIIIGQ